MNCSVIKDCLFRFGEIATGVTLAGSTFLAQRMGLISPAISMGGYSAASTLILDGIRRNYTIQTPKPTPPPPAPVDPCEKGFEELINRVNRGKDPALFPTALVLQAHRDADWIMPSSDSWDFSGVQTQTKPEYGYRSSPNFCRNQGLYETLGKTHYVVRRVVDGTQATHKAMNEVMDRYPVDTTVFVSHGSGDALLLGRWDKLKIEDIKALPFHKMKRDGTAIFWACRSAALAKEAARVFGHEAYGVHGDSPTITSLVIPKNNRFELISFRPGYKADPHSVLSCRYSKKEAQGPVEESPSSLEAADITSYLEKLAENMDGRAMAAKVILAEIYQEGGEYKARYKPKVIQLLKEAGEAGDPWACHLLACYYDPKLMVNNGAYAKEHREWLIKSAENGSAEAQYILSQMPPDSEARKWAKRAQEFGHPHMQQFVF
jgi:hypothetical protein